MDLNIQPAEFVHHKTIKLIQLMNEHEEKINYKPTKIEYKEVVLEDSGFFSSY